MFNSVKNLIKKNEYIYSIARKAKKYIEPSQDIILKQVLQYNVNRFKNRGAYVCSETKDAAYLTWLYHVVEKGLSMPNMRPGFGYDKICELCKLIGEYENKYQQNDISKAAVSVLLEYKRVHEELDYSLSDEILDKIHEVEKKHPGATAIYQKCVTRDEFFSNTNSSFDKFSYSRHCVRNYIPNAEIPIGDIIEAIEIAKNAPSACNRQPSRVHIISGHEKIMSCLEMQNGSRGFKDLADKLLIITGDLGTVLGAQEFFDLNTNVGIFIMNLCYALHFKKIGYCILN